MKQPCHSFVRRMSQSPGIMVLRNIKLMTGHGAATPSLKGENPMKKNTHTQTKKSPGGTQFYLDIRYQQNSSWQGSVQRLDTGETITFRSALELMTLMEQASKEQRNQGEEEMRRWGQREDKQDSDSIAL